MPDPAGLTRAAAALELMHASALVHDDVMDASDTRRGRPATHRAFEMLPNTAPFDVTGHPAMSLPCGMSDGLPAGLMLIAKHWNESTIYRAAHAFEQAQDWTKVTA